MKSNTRKHLKAQAKKNNKFGKISFKHKETKEKIFVYAYTLSEAEDSLIKIYGQDHRYILDM